VKLHGDELQIAYYCAATAIRRRHDRRQPIPDILQRHFKRLALAIACMDEPAGFADETDFGGTPPESRHDDRIGAAETARIIGCSPQWVRRIRADLDGEIVGGRYVFSRSIVESYAYEREIR
jgi:hypothetical protein